MKQILTYFAVLFIFVNVLLAQELPFNKFAKDKIDVGTLYIYDYSIKEEGYQPSAKKYLYIKTLNSIEVMNVSLKDTLELPDIYKYTINWNYMMLDKEEYEYAGNKDDIPIGYVGKINVNVDFKKQIFESKMLGKDKSGFSEFNSEEEFESIPTYFYQFTDFMPLWFSLRFYPMEKEKIIVNSLTGSNNVEIEIKYEGKEEINVPFGKVLCNKFTLIPQLSFFKKIFYNPKEANIWLSSEDKIHFMVKYRNDNKQYDVIPAMEYRLSERKKISTEEWEILKQNQINKVKL